MPKEIYLKFNQYETRKREMAKANSEITDKKK